MKSFSKWTIAEVEDTFHLNIQKNYSLLNEWLHDSQSPIQTEIEWLTGSF